MEQLTKNQAVATSQEAVQNQNEPQLRDENAHNDKSVHGVLNPTYQAGLRRDAVQPDIEAERKKRDEIEAGKSYCSRRFGGATCDDKSAQIYARFDKNDWRIQPAEFYRFHDAEVNTFGYQSPMLGFHKQMENRIKLSEEILSFRMQGVEFDNGDMYVDGHKAASDVRDEFVSVTEKLMDELAQCYNVL